MSPKQRAAGAPRKEFGEFTRRDQGVLPRDGSSSSRHRSVPSWRSGEGYSSLTVDFRGC